jgi:predicted DsbA family dithiol-disulfide isomerase
VDLGLDLERFEDDLGSPEVTTRVRDDMLDAEAMDITAVPTFFINGRRHVGPYDAQSLIRALQASVASP